MRTLAALMLSMMVLTTALITHALTIAYQQSPSAPAQLAGRVADDHWRRWPYPEAADAAQSGRLILQAAIRAASAAASSR